MLLPVDFGLLQGKWYRALPNPESRSQLSIQKKSYDYITKLADDDLKTPGADMPYGEAATKTKSILDFMLHALDDDGKKMSRELLVDDALTFLGAGQVTTASALSWVSLFLSIHTFTLIFA